MTSKGAVRIEVERKCQCILCFGSLEGAGSEEQVWETSNAMCLALLQKLGLGLVTLSLALGLGLGPCRVCACLRKYRLSLDDTPSLDQKDGDDDELAILAHDIMCLCWVWSLRSMLPAVSKQGAILRMARSAEAGKQHDFMRAMLVLKMGCQQWLEDHGGDTSGFVYKSVKDL